MLDIKFILQNPEKVKKILEARFMDINLVDNFLSKYEEFRKIKIESDKLRAEKNKINKEIAKYRKEKKDIKKLIENLKEIGKKIENIEEEIKKREKEIRELLYSFPNLLLPDVPVGGEDDFKIIREYGENKKITKHHQDILPNFLLDTKKASEVSGTRFFYLKGKIAELNLALQKFALDKLVSKGYIAIIPPYMLKRKPYEGVVSFEAFKDALYKIENEDLYLIATSEHSIAALHMDEILNEKDLPLKYVGISPCFRKEAGAHGKDTKGIFRVHQFNKIEQFIFCKPEESQILHEEMINNAEEIIRELEIPYRVVILASGDTSKVSAKTYDIQAWFPGQKNYREIISCSNCLDFQARRLKIRYYKNGKRIFVHTLNSTALAIERTIACIVENFYDENSNTIKIPKALWPYLKFKRIELQ